MKCDGKAQLVTLITPTYQFFTDPSGPSTTRQSLSADTGRNVKAGTKKRSPQKASPSTMPHICFIVSSQCPLPDTIQDAVTAPQQASALVYLREIVNWDGKSEGIYKVLVAAFKAKDYLLCVKNLQATNIDPLSYINCLDQVSSHLIENATLPFDKISVADY